MVVISMVVLAFDTKHKSQHTEDVIHYVDCFMIVVLAAEMAVKVIGNGWSVQIPLIDPESHGPSSEAQNATVSPASTTDPESPRYSMKDPKSETVEQAQQLECTIDDRCVAAPYWTVGWNQLDFFILLCCVGDELLYRSGWAKAKLVFRAVRAMKVCTLLTTS